MTSFLIAALAACGAACGGAAPVNEGPQVAPAASSEAKPAPETETPAAKPAEPSAAATTSAAPTPAAGPAPAAKQANPAENVLALPDLKDSPGNSELDAGAEAVRKNDFVKAQKLLGTALQKLGPSAPPAAILAGRALLGRSYHEGKADANAQREYQKVLDLWKDAKTIERLNTEGSDEAARREQKARAALAADEALFFFAEQKRAVVDKIRMPQFNGDNTKEAVTNFLNDKVTAFITQKQTAVDEADKAYQAVIDLRPTTPQWVTAAFAKRAMMRGKFNAELRAAPVPGAWKSNTALPNSTLTGVEIRTFYYAGLDEAAKPLREKARAAFEECKQQAALLGREDDFTRSCVGWLEKNIPRPATQ